MEQEHDEQKGWVALTSRADSSRDEFEMDEADDDITVLHVSWTSVDCRCMRVCVVCRCACGVR